MTNSRLKTFSKEIFVHLSVWLFLISVPFLLSINSFDDFPHLFEKAWLPLVLFAISFYLNYFWISEKAFNKDKKLSFIILNILIIIIFIAINIIFRAFLFHGDHPPMHDLSEPIKHLPPPNNKTPNEMISIFMYRDIISYLAPIIFAVAISAIKRWNKSELQQKELEQEHLKSELQQLKFQLHPHFFFNSLNNIYAMIDSYPEDAKKNIHTLAKLMRYLLYESDHNSVNLKQEIVFLEQYIELMKVRCPENIQVQYKFEDKHLNVKIPPLLFISIIENAFKHGVSTKKEADIFFSLAILDKTLIFTSKNENFAKNDTDQSGSGIGLINLQKRLNILYPNSHKLNINTENGIYNLVLKINLD